MPSSPRLAMLAAALAVCSLMACGPKTPPTVGPLVIPLAVRVYLPTALKEPEAVDILDNASKLLQVAESSGDCACPVELRLDSFGPFASDGVVNTQSDFDALFADTFPNPLAANASEPDLAPRVRQVRVVSEIYWCDGAGPSVAGCADQGGLRIAVTRRSAVLEGELWAHETGHTRGLHHRNNTWLAVMHEALLQDHKEL